MTISVLPGPESAAEVLSQFLHALFPRSRSAWRSYRPLPVYSASLETVAASDRPVAADLALVCWRCLVEDEQGLATVDLVEEEGGCRAVRFARRGAAGDLALATRRAAGAADSGAEYQAAVLDLQEIAILAFCLLTPTGEGFAFDLNDEAIEVKPASQLWREAAAKAADRLGTRPSSPIED